MPKALCLIGLVLAILVGLIFLVDLVAGLAGMLDLAPLRAASYVIDALFIISAGGIAWVAWSTFREQRH